MNEARRRFLSRWPAIAALGSLRVGPLYAGTASPRIVVAGGGFSGLNLARWLKQLVPSARITVIDPNEHYMRCPGSNRVIAGFAELPSLRHHTATSLHQIGIAFVQAHIVGRDEHKNRVHLDDGKSVAYDRLVVAPGIDFRWEQIEGLSERTTTLVPHAWRAGRQTQLLRDQLAALPAGGVFMMTVPANPYRCPPGPYERASLIAARLKQTNPRAKILILDAKSKFSKEKGFKSAWASLYPGMIEWISLETEGEIDYINPKKREVATAFNRYRADVLNVIPPQKAGELARTLGLIDDSGWCPVDPFSFKSLKGRDIHVIGDAANFGPIPKSAFAAQAEGRACALAITLDLSELPLPSPRIINHCYSLVSQNEAISITGTYAAKSGLPVPETLSLMESTPTADRRSEYVNAMDWFDVLIESTFGNPSIRR